MSDRIVVLDADMSVANRDVRRPASLPCRLLLVVPDDFVAAYRAARAEDGRIQPRRPAARSAS